MADVAWITLRIWPWQDEWLQADPDLAEEFRQHDLTDTFGSRGGDGSKLAGAMNGDIEPDEGRGGVLLSGEMRGGSYELREESSLLEMLRARGIAYVLIGDAKYEWDGDETWWHPGMTNQFTATANESGRVVTESDYLEWCAAARTPGEFVSLIAAFFDPDPLDWKPEPGYTPALVTEATR